MNSPFIQLKQQLISELQVLIGKDRSAKVTKAKSTTAKGGTTRAKGKKKLTIEEEFLILQQLQALNLDI